MTANEGQYSIPDDYPRWDVEDYRLEVEAGGKPHAIVARATFELDDSDVAAGAAVLGTDALRKQTVTLSKGYANSPVFECQVNESAALKHLGAQHQCTAAVMGQLDVCDSIAAASEVLTKSEQTAAVAAPAAVLQQVNQSGVARCPDHTHLSWALDHSS